MNARSKLCVCSLRGNRVTRLAISGKGSSCTLTSGTVCSVYHSGRKKV